MRKLLKEVPGGRTRTSLEHLWLGLCLRASRLLFERISCHHRCKTSPCVPLGRNCCPQKQGLRHQKRLPSWRPFGVLDCFQVELLWSMVCIEELCAFCLDSVVFGIVFKKQK